MRRVRRATPRFDEIVHAPHRLRICALLAPLDSMEFGVVRDELGVADSVLSKQLKVLVDAGYATTSKAQGETGRARTWLSLTQDGRRAFAGHLEALRKLAAMAEASAPQAGNRPGAPST
ncbi:MAG: transcriptional regulator [Propionibacteriaceae bacterium]|nr:transcriptional regulator [Propionibacteriaceae bacterium]